MIIKSKICASVVLHLMVILLTSSSCFGLTKDDEDFHEVVGGDLSLRLDNHGRIVGLVFGKNKQRISVSGGSRLEQCQEEGDGRVEKMPNGTIKFVRVLADKEGRRFTITEHFVPRKNSIRWDIDIHSELKPWTAPIHIGLHWPVGKNTRFWTAWSDPDLIGSGGWDPARMKAEGWRDPLETRSFADASRWYGGNPEMMVPSSGDYFSIPLCVVLEPDISAGVSLIQSPEDTLVDMKLVTSSNGTMEFQHLYHRLGDDRHLKFSLDLVAHEADWRCGLEWMAERYPEYFKPVNPKAAMMAGCGAYSSWEGELDVEKLKKMAFRINWKASFDFPYMGMFLPPVETWRTFATYQEATKDPWVKTEYKGQVTSIKKQQQYCKRMNDYGFHVLNYFNVTEFGTKVRGPDTVNHNISEGELWKISTDFLHTRIADGILYNNEGEYYRTWGDAVVMDCGAKNYQAFLIEQAHRHLEKLPASSGICIDRLDWLRHFNSRADDRVSWYKNKPARSLITSWKDLMEKMGPMMHKEKKVIFANPMVSMRIDILRHIDGIYSEHNEIGPALNASALLGIHMPVLAWTWDEDSLRPDPDLFFQRMLYLGVFPTAPMPYNNHTILPSAFADKWYLDYGPLLNALSGRRWLLKPRVVKVTDDAAKAHVFEVPGGYSIPVVFAAEEVTNATVVLNKKYLLFSGNFTVDALHPAIVEPAAVKLTSKGEKLILEVPLRRGCAVIRLKNHKH